MKIGILIQTKLDVGFDNWKQFKPTSFFMHIIIGEETKFSIRIGRPIFYGFVLYIYFRSIYQEKQCILEVKNVCSATHSFVYMCLYVCVAHHVRHGPDIYILPSPTKLKSGLIYLPVYFKNNIFVFNSIKTGCITI